MNDNPFNFLLKYSTSTCFLIALCLVQFCHCYSENKWTQEQEPPLQQSDTAKFDNGYYNYHNGYSLQNISSRDLKIKPDISSSNIPKPVFVAYHRSLHNTSWAITIPLFSFLLPIANTGDPLFLGNQALYGFFAAVITIISFAVPILFNGQVPGARSLENSKVSLEHLIHPGRLVNLVGLNIGNQIGIDPMQCLQKTVCEAYRSPQNERYGLLAWPFQYFFKADNTTSDSSSVKSIYELAARDGKFTKKDCRKKYECMFDVLDLATYCLSVYKKSRKRTKDDEAANDFINHYSTNTVNHFTNEKNVLQMSRM